MKNLELNQMEIVSGGTIPRANDGTPLYSCWYFITI